MPTTPEEIAANPIGTDLVFEDDTVRIWVINLAPGADAGWHTHYLDYTTVVLEGDRVERPNADGTVDRIDVKPGQLMRWYNGTLRHALKNIGTKPFRNVIVEIKNTNTGAE
jgi:quercetin dioxygenase-like cupin family protein